MQPSKKEFFEQLYGRGGIVDVPGRGFDNLVDELRVANERLVLASVREQQIAEQSEYQAAKLNALLNNVDEGVIIANPHGEIVMANPLARKMLGFAEHRSLTLQADWAKIEMRQLSGLVLPIEDRPLQRALRGELFAEYEILVLLPNGEECRISFTSGMVRDDDGDVTLAILLFRDVSELRQLERQREEYLSLISHDLRTPLTVIMGRAEWLTYLANRDGYQGMAKEVESIFRNAKRMQAMLGDFLETARLEAGQARLEKQLVDLQAVIVGVVEDIIARNDQSRVHIVASPALPFVLADVARLERVIANLITNAFKFSEPDTPIEIQIGRKGPEVMVSVIDRGVGIAPEDLPRIFERYYQTSAGVKRRGQGLGLYLSRLIVEALGGRIWATSTLGQGSNISFSLPIR